MKFKDSAINLTWTKINGEPMLKVLHRNKKIKFEKLPFRPYFFITKSDFLKAADLLEKTAKKYRIDYYAEAVDAITADTKEFVIQISTQYPSDVKKLRMPLETHGIRTYEADVPYSRRLLIDLNDALAKPKKILHMDIEVDARSKFSDPEEAENRIISIGAVDYKGREFFFSYDNEAEMIADFFDLAKKYELLTAWNANYDITYLANRAKKLGLTIGHVSKRGDKTQIFEHPHLDLQKVFKNVFRRKVRSYALKAVARDFLGKEDVIEIETRDDMIKLWESFVGDKKFLREYNLQDCWLLKEIDEAANLIDIQYSIVDLCSLESYDARGMSTYVESYLLKVAKDDVPRVVFQTKIRDEEREDENGSEDTYTGGLVENRSPGLHKNVILLDINCFTEDHYVLTPDGLKKITDFKVGDKVYTLNPETLEAEIDEVVEVHKYRYKGKLYRIRNQTGEIVEVTPNHWFCMKFGDRIKWIMAEELKNRSLSSFLIHRRVKRPIQYDKYFYIPEHLDCEIFIDKSEMTADVKKFIKLKGGSYRIRKQYYHISGLTVDHLKELEEKFNINILVKLGMRGRPIPYKLPLDLLVDLIAWYITEGSSSGNKIVIAQSKDQTRKMVETMMEAVAEHLNRRYHKYDNDSHHRISSKVISKLLEQLCGKDAYSKKIPDFIFKLDNHLLERFLRILIYGDGSIRNNKYTYSTKSKILAEQVAHLMFLLGYYPTIRYREDKESWVVYTRKTVPILKKEWFEEVDFDGYVYCITAKKNHLVFVCKDLGHLKRFYWVGQSTYPMIIKTFNIGLETFRENKWEGDIIAPHGSFTLKKESTLAKMVDNLIVLRKWAKENRNKYHPDSIEYKIWDAIQFAYKFVVNSIYGVMGFEDSRLYRRELAENVTLICRAIIRFVDEYLRNNFKNLQVIYLDSVHPSVCIPIIVGDKLLVEPIESIWNQFAKNVVVRPDGKEEFYPENMYTFTRKGIRKVKRIIRHKCSKECVLLRARPGAPFVTKDHSIIVNGREVTPLELVEKNLEPDSIKVRWSPKSIVDEIDVLDYIDRRKYKIIFSNDKLVIVKSIKGPKRYKIPRKIKLNREFGYVLGAYISEGSILGKKGQVRLIGARSKDFVETVYTCATKVFGKENVTFIRTGRHVHLRKVFAKMFEDLCGRGAENKRLPYFFFNAPKEFQEALVEAYIRGDGKEEKYGCSFGTTSRTLASQLAFYFKLCGHGVRASAIVREEGEKLPKGYVRKEDLIEYKVGVFYDDLLRDDSPWKKLRKNEILYTDTPEYVYDLEVEDDHTFIDALGCIVLHNTDGLYVKLPDNLTKEQVVEVGQYLVHKINTALKKWIPIEFGVPEDRVFIEIKLDRAAYTAYFPKSKKRYSLFCFYEDGQFADYYHIKGFGVKSNMPVICREIQKKVLEMILNEKSSSEIIDYLKEVRERLFKGELDDKLVMYITLKKDPSEYKRKTAHGVVAEKLKKMGIQVAIGDKIPCIPLGSIDDYIPYIPGKTKLTEKQYELFWNNYVISALEQLDLDDSILSKVRNLSQRSLDDFF